jgi:chaperone required for assembly of F1-ATPase
MADEGADQRRDAYRTAQGHVKQAEVKRFYIGVGIGETDGGFTVELDGRALKSPGKTKVVVPTRALAEAMAREWDAQGSIIAPGTMPVTRLVNSAVEGGAAAEPGLRSEIVKYAGGDLMLYRADTPRELVLAQEEGWDPVLVGLARHFGVAFQPTIGIMYQAQPAVSIANLTGSGLLTLALRQGLIDAETAWTAAHVDEDYNIRVWGEDEEAAALRAKRRVEYEAAVGVLGWLG